MAKNNTFYEVTNTDIYTKLLEIEEHVITTNGKVRLNKWVATTALTLVTTVIFLLISGIIK